MSLTRILCTCCGYPLAWCTCWAGQTTDMKTWETRSESCKPEDHRR